MRTPADVTVYNMMATPFRDDGALDLDGYAALLENMCAANIGVYLGSGGAGEGHALSVAELRDVYSVGVQVCKGRVPVAANPREPRTAADMLDLATAAATAGVDLVQLYSLDAGHGMKPTAAELERYYTFLLDRLDHPTAISVHMYYAYPVTPTLLADLCGQYPQVEAINVIMPTPYFLEVREALASVPRDIRLYTSMMTMVEGLYAGSSGVQAAEPNIIPFSMRRLVDSVLTGDLATAGELFPFVYDVMRVCSRWAPSTARWLKMALKVLDLPGANGVLREPYLLPGAGELASMGEAFERLDVRGWEERCRAEATAR